jgi:hypothetical protein
MWEANGQELEVAMYVRTLAESELRGAKVALRTLLVRMQEHLGISQPGLARNHWIIDAGQPEHVELPEAPSPALTSNARDRMREVVARAN